MRCSTACRVGLCCWECRAGMPHALPRGTACCARREVLLSPRRYAVEWSGVPTPPGVLGRKPLRACRCATALCACARAVPADAREPFRTIGRRVCHSAVLPLRRNSLSWGLQDWYCALAITPPKACFYASGVLLTFVVSLHPTCTSHQDRTADPVLLVFRLCPSVRGGLFGFHEELSMTRILVCVLSMQPVTIFGLA